MGSPIGRERAMTEESSLDGKDCMQSAYRYREQDPTNKYKT